MSRTRRGARTGFGGRHTLYCRHDDAPRRSPGMLGSGGIVSGRADCPKESWAARPSLGVTTPHTHQNTLHPTHAAALRATEIIRSLDGAELALEKEGRQFSLKAQTRANRGQRVERALPPSPTLYVQRGSTRYWWKYLLETKTLYIQ